MTAEKNAPGKELPRRFFSGQQMKKIRQDRGLTQVDLGIRMFQIGGAKNVLARQQIDAWEAEIISPQARHLWSIAAALDVPIDDLFVHGKINENIS